MPAATELHQRGIDAINAGHTLRARAHLERARARTSDPDLVARIDATLAYVVGELDGSDEALALCGSALEREGLSTETRGILRSQRALLLMRRGETAAALADFADAVSDLARSPHHLGKARMNRGGVYLQQRRLALAAEDFAAAADALEHAADALEAAKARHNLGYVHLSEGRLVEALVAMDRARPVLAPLGAVTRAVCDQDRGEVLLAAGLVEEGVASLESAARAYGVRRLRRRQGEAELALARHLVVSAPRRALVAARAAARHFTSDGAVAWQRRAEAIALQAEVDLGRHGAALARRAAILGPALTEQGLRDGAAAVEVLQARLRLRAGEGDPARDLTGGGRAGLEVRLMRADVRAEIAAARARTSEALRHLRAGLADLHAWQSSFGSLDLQTGVAGHGVRLGVRGLALAVESRRPAVLLEWSERARMLASRVQPVRPPEDERIVADLAELRAGPPAAREAELRQRIRERAWQVRGSGEVADPVTLAELRAGLAADTALVAYVVTADEVVALVVTTERATWVDLGPRAPLDDLLGGLLPDLDVTAADLPEPMAGAVRGVLVDRLRRLAALLVTPVLKAVGDRRVVLTPSGVLAGVPWTLLDGYVGRPVTVAQSATSWLARSATPLRTTTAGFVAGPRVVRAEDEVTAAAKEWTGARVLVGPAATAAAVSELAEQVDVLHVAAHGRHSSENPLFSGLLLADGSWFGYDVDRLRAVPNVVLLSACEVGRSTVRWGEELIGMSAAWLHAGARCVIASAAAVNDAAAYDVLVAVHQQLAAGVDPAAALAAAVPAVSTGTAPVPLVCFS